MNVTERFLALLKMERDEARPVYDSTGPRYVTRTIGPNPRILAHYSWLELAHANAHEYNRLAVKHGGEHVEVLEVTLTGHRRLCPAGCPHRCEFPLHCVACACCSS